MNTQDQINFANHDEVQRAAFAVIDRLQDYNSGTQVAGSGLVFLLVCERLGINPRDALVKASAILKDSLSFGTGEQTRAIKTYLQKEI